MTEFPIFFVSVSPIAQSDFRFFRFSSIRIPINTLVDALDNCVVAFGSAKATRPYLIFYILRSVFFISK